MHDIELDYASVKYPVNQMQQLLDKYSFSLW